MFMMKWRIAERILQFTNKLRTKDTNNIAKRTLDNEVILGLKGSKSKCSQFTKKVGIPDVHWTWQTKKSIKNAVREANTKEIKESVEKTRKVEDR